MLLCGVFVSCFASVWNPEFSAQLDLDDRQGFIASSAMQQKKKVELSFRPIAIDMKKCQERPGLSLAGPMANIIFWSPKATNHLQVLLRVDTGLNP